MVTVDHHEIDVSILLCKLGQEWRQQLVRVAGVEGDVVRHREARRVGGRRSGPPASVGGNPSQARALASSRSRSPATARSCASTPSTAARSPSDICHTGSSKISTDTALDHSGRRSSGRSPGSFDPPDSDRPNGRWASSLEGGPDWSATRALQRSSPRRGERDGAHPGSDPVQAVVLVERIAAGYSAAAATDVLSGLLSASVCSSCWGKVVVVGQDRLAVVL